MRLALAGGGTGGHVVPGLHLLAGQQERLADLLWFGAGRQAEERALQALAPLVAPTPVERVRLTLEPAGGGAPSSTTLVLNTLPALLGARAALKRHQSEVLIGLGGFTCLPAVLAARSLGVPVALLEINSVPGKATRSLARLAQRVVHAWPDSMPERGAPGKHLCLGPPLAPSFTQAWPAAESPAGLELSQRERQALGFDPARPLLLVLGGSQGAGALNRFIAQQLSWLLSSGLQVLHQTGPGRLDEGGTAQPGYHKFEYLDGVEHALLASTAVLCRGGASTLAEVGALRRPAMVVPYPHHADRHQERNARQLGAGVLVVDERELSRAVAAELLRLTCASGGVARAAMAQALAAAVPRDAVARLWRELEQLAKRAPRGLTAAGLA